jgi:hypothetical protein
MNRVCWRNENIVNIKSAGTYESLHYKQLRKCLPLTGSIILYWLGTTDIFKYNLKQPITLTALSKARNIFTCSNTEIVGLNPTRGMDVCVCSVFALSCIGRGLATGLTTRPRRSIVED